MEKKSSEEILLQANLKLNNVKVLMRNFFAIMEKDVSIRILFRKYFSKNQNQTIVKL